jgi:hypothetical protein
MQKDGAKMQQVLRAKVGQFIRFMALFQDCMRASGRFPAGRINVSITTDRAHTRNPKIRASLHHLIHALRML